MAAEAAEQDAATRKVTAKELIQSMSSASNEELEELADDKRKTVANAAKAEQKARKAASG